MAATVTPEAVEKTVIEALPQFGVDESQITRDATFEELDVDSLDLAELSQIIEDEYGVRSRATTSARSRPSATRSTWW